MAREFSRTDRVAQQIHKEVASLLQNEYKHRIGNMPFITVSGVEVSRDLAHAKVFITFYENDEEVVKSHMKLLIENIAFLRGLLAKRIRMRSVPHLHFFEDKSITEGMRISNLVSETIARDKARQTNTDEDQDDQQD
ncbi:ribosome-binding factor A [Marisediminitalea aggregata]|jgi:ribosome-binding factor A|uniref:Ribosome-binding factor A n=1 Tax=Marisediminitalea aggregata TaxID=634436 RepID=A0A1M5JAR8_9ALTE|nr:30S ribosome-binding factor RbfA [Marisediminitalea aggregata]MAP19898.1 30S ribosome-binding factor RbfA [Alteromonadaceae bacterium]MCP3862109.1 30S ribosome-binding factor RbfA [Aestuariibacter sp.]MEC7470574.1 30S ribosome-binding factor RbfA [Pseudomonadota bacterium]BBO27413.1 ribosome-binding factor A [Alteromonas sp. I4]HBY40707.1 30S ribosome-binding factor RbfA [Alteromonas sp.]|tara:strand:+ start:75 stop:485 length:411 start_codon:yes stop_codon:yes gene_type:complete